MVAATLALTACIRALQDKTDRLRQRSGARVGTLRLQWAGPARRPRPGSQCLCRFWDMMPLARDLLQKLFIKVCGHFGAHVLAARLSCLLPQKIQFALHCPCAQDWKKRPSCAEVLMHPWLKQKAAGHIYIHTYIYTNTPLLHSPCRSTLLPTVRELMRSLYLFEPVRSHQNHGRRGREPTRHVGLEQTAAGHRPG